MSDATVVPVHPSRADSSTADAVSRQLEQLVEPGEAGLVVAFAEAFFAKAPPDFLHERSVDALAHLVLGAFRFLQRSRPDRVDVEVLNPTIETEGWAAPVTVVRANISDRPFIVDTMREYLHAEQLAIEYMIYPAPFVRRDADGAIRELRAAAPDEPKESLVHVEVSQLSEPERLEQIRREVARRLQDVIHATDDFPAMRDQASSVADELGKRARNLPDRADELAEIQEFLGWLSDGAFVFLGYRAYDLVEAAGRVEIVVEPGSGLGILRNETVSSYADGVALESLDPSLRALVEEGPTLIISKTKAEATVHRRARMDYIGVKKLDAAGAVAGEHRFIGLFTSRAYSEDAEDIPILRNKIRRILEETGVAPGSHDYKEIKTIFNSMPKEELFLTSTEQIWSDVVTVLTSYHTDEVRVTLREDVLHRGVSAMVIIPRERYSGDVRKQIERTLSEAFQGEVLNFHLALEGGDQARLHFYMGAHPERLQRIRTADLEQAVRELTRSWSDRVREGLERVRPPDEARRLARRYGEAFSSEYQAATAPTEAVEDVLELEAMQAQGRTASISFNNGTDSSWVPGDDEVTQLKLCQIGGRLVLSEFMPMLENAGLRVIAVNPFEVRGGGVPSAIVYTFAVQDKAGMPLDLERTAAVGETILAVRAGDLSNDIVNGLVLSTGLHWREVDVLRALSAYAFQLGAVPARFALPAAMLKHPHVARMMFELFQVKFDPDRPTTVEERKDAARDVKAAIVTALQGVTLLAEDRALRRMLMLVEAAVRTSFYRHGGRTPTKRSGGVPYVSFKFACDQLSALGKSRLLYEVWVRSSRMEGVHLRGAKVARGGIRWSDRLDDFRIEILGLVKTQMVKNAVIVPSGSKGGFVLLKAPAEAEKLGEEGKEQYRTLVRGLLDVTDNLDAAGTLLPPDRVVAFDEPDPYLVVAADKGTAKFSDVANAISAEYDFWLGDAFASGGSQGYDHKEVGITAKGGWECVKRHFREKGKDIQQEPFTVVGIGDMSGDVFGNGMLLSRQIRLLAAFDHRHVFLDPDPDPERSFVERERVFGLGRSSWADYDAKLLSPGGMIVPRGAKEVTLTAPALQALGLPAETAPMDGEALIRAVLKAPVEMLWNGGIGTYVKAADETHADAGDTTNDAVRVDAEALRCMVVGEGGNLGFTQRARIHYAQAGGRINTDALDNSAGVDLSDHEVNLKILLNPGVRSGRMSETERNELLEALTDEVAALVLRANRSQSLAVSLDELRAAERLDDFRDLITAFEKAGFLERAAETLPTFEALLERHEAGKSLTRPELCVLLAYGKLWVKGQVLKSALPDDPVLDGYLVGYFPPAAVAAAGDELLHGHRLRREIVTLQLTNDLVDLMGSDFVMRLVRDSGRSPADVVRAWVIAARLADHRAVLARLLEQDAVLPTRVQYLWLLRLGRVLERTARWVLRNVPAEAPTGPVIDASLQGLGALREHFSELVTGADKELYESRLAEIKELGAADALARDLISLRFLDQLLDVLRVAQETGADPVEAARAFYRVSGLLHVPWLRTAILASARDDRWEQRAAQALVADLGRAHHKLVAQVMRGRAAAGSVDRAADRMVESRADDVGRFQTLLQEIQSEPAMSLSGLSVAVREIALLSERMNGGTPQ
ncbi:MAG: NAD-glutamate dehydrogenase [Gemmatimonadetes bacterium]|nr:NAD-glutamate dehydrogenase [Gemmatimonadota bacterium]